MVQVGEEKGGGGDVGEVCPPVWVKGPIGGFLVQVPPVCQGSGPVTVHVTFFDVIGQVHYNVVSSNGVTCVGGIDPSFTPIPTTTLSAGVVATTFSVNPQSGGDFHYEVRAFDDGPQG